MVRTLMIRLALGVMGGALVAGAAFPQAAPENEDSRFSFFRAADGFLRLDGESGQVSLCTRHQAGWACQAVPEERAALEAEIARLQSENAALKKEVLSRGLPLPGGGGGDVPTAAPRAPDRLLTQITDAIGNAWRRFVAAVASAERDLLHPLPFLPPRAGEG